MQKCIGLSNVISAFTNLAAVLLSKIVVILQACRPASPLGSSQQPQSTRIFQQRLGRLPIAAFTIDKMVVSTIDAIESSIDLSSPGQCEENSWVLVSPTVFPATSGLVLATGPSYRAAFQVGTNLEAQVWFKNRQGTWTRWLPPG